MILVLAMAVTLAILQPFGVTLLGIPIRPRPIQPDFFKELGRIAEYQGLHKAARYNGGTFVYDFNIAHQGHARNLQQLVDFAPLIVVGTIRTGEPRERPHAWIETIYSVLASETVKGDARSVVKVRVPGGRLTFRDGTVAEVRTPGFALRAGGTYVLFLQPAPVGVGTDPTDVTEGVQVLALGHQSVVDVSTGRTQASLRSDDPIRMQLLDRDGAGFLNEIRALARRER
jgi:hypothetical protein